MKKQILLFSVNEEQQAKIKTFCDSLGIAVQAMDHGSFAQPLKDILGLPKSSYSQRSRGKVHSYSASDKCKSYGITGFPEPMMVFCNLEQQDLDAYLAGYSQAGIKKVNLKSVLTPYNISWTPEELYEELLSEHSAITGQ